MNPNLTQALLCMLLFVKAVILMNYEDEIP